MPDDNDLLLGGLYAFYVVLFLLALAFLAGGWWLFAGIPLREARRARAAGDWWLPFLPRADGSWGPLVRNAKKQATRAHERGGRGGLAARWGVWGVAGVGVTFAAGAILVQMVRLALQAT